MANPKLTRLEMQIMEIVWTRGACAIREIQEGFPEPGRPAYTTVQTTVYRLESKKALRRVKKIGNANIFEAAISRGEAQGRLIDELLALFGGRTQPVMSRMRPFCSASGIKSAGLITPRVGWFHLSRASTPRVASPSRSTCF